MTDLEDARRRWLRERAQYERFGEYLADKLRKALQKEGIWANVSCRPKEVDSLIRKLVKKPEYTYETLGDKSGVRIILRYKGEIDAVLAIVGALLECSDPDQKVESLEPDQVGYLSTHLEVKLGLNDPLSSEFPPKDFSAELQVRTLSQHLWSEMSHDTFYKNDETISPLPKRIKRRIFVLAGVVEVADEEFNRVKSEMPATAEIEVLKTLEKHYYKLTTRRPDSEVSLNVIRLLIPLYEAEPRQIAARLDEFYADNKCILETVFARHEETIDRSAYLLQPEALMIYERLENDAMSTRKAWNLQYPERELERLANAFGISFD